MDKAEAFLKFLEFFSEDKPKEKEEAPKEKQEETPKEKVEDNDELAAIKAELAELKAARENPQTEDPVKTENDDDEETPREKELRERIEKQETDRIKDSLRNGLVTSGLDEDHFDVLSDFIEYGKLKGEDGSADEERVSNLVDALTSIALRQPPASREGNKTYDPSNQGMGKYLKMEVN